MGEEAKAMLDGTLCQECGQYLGGDDGHPVTCPDCLKEDDHASRKSLRKLYRSKIANKAGAVMTEHNNGTHFIVEAHGRMIDVWPTKDHWKVRGGKKGRGVNDLVQRIDVFSNHPLTSPNKIADNERSRLTRREQFAMAAMQAITSADTQHEMSCDLISTQAVEQADALIAELDKQPEDR